MLKVINMKKFTIVANFRGGTFVSQYNAYSVVEAIMIWAENLDLQYFQEKEKRKILKELKDWGDEVPPTLLDGLTTVWYKHINVYRRFVDMNIVETVGESSY